MYLRPGNPSRRCYRNYPTQWLRRHYPHRQNLPVCQRQIPEEAKPYTLHYGEIKDKDGNTIDDVLVSVFRAPHSYTGENSTEISCHGSRYILQQVLHRFTEVGCRQAEPGEYTRRAYLNGKMDLSGRSRS